MKKNYKMKKTISMKLFITELGESFSEHMKNRLMELEIRCVLTRKEESNILDLKHVEHTKHEFECDSESAFDVCQKEYTYGEFLVIEGALYFSDNCLDSDKVTPSPIVSEIYNSLSSETATSELGIIGKKVDDSNIDYVIDTMLTVFPQVTKEYMSIMSKYYKKK